MLQCSENILIGHSCFFVNRYACSQFSEIFNWSHLVFCDIKYAFSCSSANGRADHIVLCHLFRKPNRKVSRCLYEEVEAPSTKLNSPTFWGDLYSTPPGNVTLLCADIRAHMFLWGGGGIGLKAFYSPVFHLIIE